MTTYKSEVTHDSGERFYTDVNNEQYISVTTLLSKYEDTKFLTAWKNRIGHEEANKVAKEAADLGTRTHSQIEFFLSEDYSQDWDNLEKQHYNSFAIEAIENFYRYVKPIEMEQVIFYNQNDLRFCGRYDALVEVPCDTFRASNTELFIPQGKYIIDLKTKQKPPRLDILDYMFKYCLQLSSYVHSYEQFHNDDLKGAIIIYVTKNKCRKMYIDKNQVRYYWSLFYKLLLDYYKIAPLSTNWNEMIKEATLSYDFDTEDLVSYKPIEIE